MSHCSNAGGLEPKLPLQPRFDYQLEGTSIIHESLESDGQESTKVVVEDTGQLEPGLLLEF